MKSFICAGVILCNWFFPGVLKAQSTNEPPHPILTISGSTSGVDSILNNWTEVQYTNNFVPRQSPRNDSYGFVPEVVTNDTGWSWSSSNPNQITSTPSGTILPSNTNYVIKTQAVTVLSGKTINVPYYNRAGSSSSKSLVFALIDYRKRSQLRTDLSKLGPAYMNSGSSHTTRNQNYARRIAIALLDWARWFPDYFMTEKNSSTFLNVTPSYVLPSDKQRASDHNGLAHEWADDELLAFDAIYDSVALTNLSTELGFDVRSYIKSNLFCNEGDFIVYHVPPDVATDSNLSGPFTVLGLVARVLNRPDYILWLDQYLSITVREKIHRDGALSEGMGYSIGYINENTGAAKNTRDYFLSRPADTPQLQAISNRVGGYVTTLTYGNSQWSQIALPNGQLPSFGDTPFNNYFSARNTGISALMPSYGTVSMGAGSSSSTAVQLNQNFSGDNNHMRSDTTAYTLWAFGNEYLGNVRYHNGTAGRQFTEQILAYNAVTIDRTDMTSPSANTYGNGDLTLYEAGNNGLAVTEIDGQRAYSNKASRYQRIMMLNTLDIAKPYVVDVFRVTGGTTHDYLFHGSIRYDSTAECSFLLVTNPATYPMLEGSEVWVEPTSSGSTFPYYGFWRNVNSNQAPGDFQITYRDTASNNRDARLWMTDDGTAKVYSGRTPVPARANGEPDNWFVNGLWRPSSIIRKRITSGTLQNLFVSVIEPMNNGVSIIQNVERLPMNGSSLESCALKITFTDGRVDTVIVNLRNPQVAGANTGSATVSTTDGKYSLTGRIGVHCDRPSTPQVWTVHASDFQYAGRRLSTPTNIYFSGLITGETRRLVGGSNDAFITTSPLPIGTALRNKQMSLTFGTLSGSGTTGISEMFKIDQVILSNSEYYVCFTNDHQLEITNGATSVEQMGPLRKFTTTNSFEIALSASAQQISAIADQNIPPGGSSGALNFNFGNLGSTAGASLQVSAVSSNQTLIPNSNLVLGGSGTSRTITVTPVAGQTGASLITVSVTDGVWTNSRSFLASVGNFAIVTSPSSKSVLAGNSVNFTNIVSATNGSGTVNFTLDELPAGVSANFSPATFTGSGTNTLSLSVATNALAGAYPLTISATAGSQSASNTVTLVVNVVSPTPGSSTWLGASSSGSFWSDATNWSSALVPGNSLVFGGITRINNTNDTAAGTTYSNVVFNSGAGAFTLNGNHISLIVGITNNSSAPQTISLGINFSNSIVLNGASNPLVIAGGLTNNFGALGSTTVTLAGSGTLKNLFKSTLSPGGTNILLLNSSAANWKLADNDASAPCTVPWAFAINNGTFSFGDDTNTPTLTMTTPNNTPQDNQVGAVSGGNGVFNFANGTLTTSSRFNTATSLNSTGTVNQTGGTLNIGSQFQGANGSNLGEVSVVNVSGGVMNLGSAASPTSPFYVASRGTGTLTVANTGTVSCGRLDISRNAAGNTISSAGTVNLDGGTLSVTSVTNISANQQTGGSPTATFNFNGGTLVAKSGAASMFFQGSLVAPVTPIKTFVKAGGAIIDDGGQSITIGEALQHFAALGSNPDGGLTKLNSGTLTLISNNTYTGDTVLSAGTLALTGSGSISNATNISISAGATLSASGRSDGKLTLNAWQTLSGDGRLTGNTVVNGTISPGADIVGTLTNTGDMTLGAGGRYIFDMQDAGGSEPGGTNWDFISASGNFSIQSTSTNPFVIQLRSLDSNPGDNTPGAANFVNGSSQNWTIAMAAAGVTSFSTNKFTVDSVGFENDLAGGYFIVTTINNSLLLTFVPNHPPSANDVVFYVAAGGALQIPISSLVPQWSDPDGDATQFLGVNSSSATGTNNVSTDGNFIYYTNTSATADIISYTLGDVRTNPPAVYRPGDTMRTGVGLIQIFPPPNPTVNISAVNGDLVFSGSNGIPDGDFYVLSSSNLALPLNQWTRMATNVFDQSGSFHFTNPPSEWPVQFYLLQLP